jgi:hypothetical protein
VIVIVGFIVVRSLLILIVSVDRKIFAAMSSVLHITLCILVRLYVMLLIRYIHIVISPYMFVTVYIVYLNRRTRYYIKIGFVIIIL